MPDVKNMCLDMGHGILTALNLLPGRHAMQTPVCSLQFHAYRALVKLLLAQLPLRIQLQFHLGYADVGDWNQLVKFPPKCWRPILARVPPRFHKGLLCLKESIVSPLVLFGCVMCSVLLVQTRLACFHRC